ncbi:Vacuolar protein 14-like protein [Rozella allomycis CSF55]|uniref:Vacuolar protein 14-like protein n=1 Tax=Rozella allomycis (strain CSF55) TaxID=988480 RepID=A0A075AVW1_ROZAC|nr:Vacuolar protein 14-like protein [Rozella allomycis CSF55]|eukprot:EPZ34458.1 Vacuolar protein 14-like protein [Rozella allomycis CSF55]
MDADQILKDICPPILACFSDQDSRVRYYACEAMYNIAKTTRHNILIYFNEIFDCLCKLCTDVELSVRNGAELLDRLLRDIVNEKPIFNVEKFIPLIKERIFVQMKNARQFLVSWVCLLHSLPELNFIVFLPEFLDGLFRYLSDESQDIRTMTRSCLDAFLSAISMREKTDLDMRRVSVILLDFATMEGLLFHFYKLDDLPREIALQWLETVIKIDSTSIVFLSDKALFAIVRSMSCSSLAIREIGTSLNSKLFQIIQSSNEDIGYDALTRTLVQFATQDNESARLASLDWLLMIHLKCPQKVRLFKVFGKSLSDCSEEAIKKTLHLLSQISSSFSGESFNNFIIQLLELFKSDRKLLETKGSLIIRQLCISLQPEKVFCSFSEFLEIENVMIYDLEFASFIVQHLTIILLTATELVDLRRKLKFMDLKDNISLFHALYKSWVHNPVSTLALCFLAQMYEHAYYLIMTFSEYEITVNFLVQVDKLVQLIESPIFSFLRLQLLEPDKYFFLYKSLYGLLMLLPQSSAFATLRNRLNSVQSVSLLSKPTLSSPVEKKTKTTKEFLDLISYFKQVQAKHEKERRQSLFPPQMNILILLLCLFKIISYTGIHKRFIGLREVNDGSYPAKVYNDGKWCYIEDGSKEEDEAIKEKEKENGTLKSKEIEIGQEKNGGTSNANAETETIGQPSATHETTSRPTQTNAKPKSLSMSTQTIVRSVVHAPTNVRYVTFSKSTQTTQKLSRSTQTIFTSGVLKPVHTNVNSENQNPAQTNVKPQTHSKYTQTNVRLVPKRPAQKPETISKSTQTKITSVALSRPEQTKSSSGTRAKSVAVTHRVDSQTSASPARDMRPIANDDTFVLPDKVLAFKTPASNLDNYPNPFKLMKMKNNPIYKEHFAYLCSVLSLFQALEMTHDSIDYHFRVYAHIGNLEEFYIRANWEKEFWENIKIDVVFSSIDLYFDTLKYFQPFFSTSRFIFNIDADVYRSEFSIIRNLSELDKIENLILHHIRFDDIGASLLADSLLKFDAINSLDLFGILGISRY